MASQLLLVIIYIAFIGLGIPDSLFGTAWPAIYKELHLQVSSAGLVTALISGGTIVSSLAAPRLIRRLGTGLVTAGSTLMTAAALLGFSNAKHLLWLCAFAIPLGLGAGAIDTALNNYIALHYRAAHMSFLHCFYGIGVSISPFLMSQALRHTSWRMGYHKVFWLQLAIAMLTIAALPLWRQAQQKTEIETTSDFAKTSLFGLLKERSVRRVCSAFIGSCGLEYTCGIWGSTFLVDHKGITDENAAQIVMVYYIGMAVGRFLSGLFVSRLTSQRVMRIGQGVTLAALILLCLPIPAGAAGIVFFAIGFGNGPVFPNLLHLTPKLFGESCSQMVIGMQMAASYTSILFMPVLFGFLAEYVSISLFPYQMIVLFILMLFGSTYRKPISMDDGTQ